MALSLHPRSINIWPSTIKFNLSILSPKITFPPKLSHSTFRHSYDIAGSHSGKMESHATARTSGRILCAPGGIRFHDPDLLKENPAFSMNDTWPLPLIENVKDQIFERYDNGKNNHIDAQIALTWTKALKLQDEDLIRCREAFEELSWESGRTGPFIYDEKGEERLIVRAWEAQVWRLDLPMLQFGRQEIYDYCKHHFKYNLDDWGLSTDEMSRKITFILTRWGRGDYCCFKGNTKAAEEEFRKVNPLGFDGLWDPANSSAA